MTDLSKIDKTSAEWIAYDQRCTTFSERVQYNADRKIIAFCTKERAKFLQSTTKETHNE